MLAARHGVLLFLALTVLAGWSGPATAAPAAGAEARQVLLAFSNRVTLARAQRPLIIRSAEAAAERVAAHPQTLISVPYGDQPSFAEEVLNRAGGLANALPPEERPALTTATDVVLFSVRSWEKNTEHARVRVAQARTNGWLLVLFASRAGWPADLTDGVTLIDNGASSPAESEAPVNSIANVLNVWLWTCEYVAALTRHGKDPGILKSILLPGSSEHNQAYQRGGGRLRLDDGTNAIPPGVLSDAYLKRVDLLMADLAGDQIQGQLAKAADIISRRMAAGGKVGVATCTHFGMAEIMWDNRSPFKPFNVVWRAKKAFDENLKPGDLLLWIGYVGLSTPYEDYGKYMRETKADLVTCCIPDPNPTNNAPEALAHIDQSWALGDAEVSIPYPPGRMAPVSGIDVGLLYRLLDAAVAERLAKTGK